MVTVLELGPPVGARLVVERGTVGNPLVGGLGTALRLGSTLVLGLGLGPGLGT